VTKAVNIEKGGFSEEEPVSPTEGKTPSTLKEKKALEAQVPKSPANG